MIKVLVAEDEKPLLRGIKTLIEKLAPEFSVVKCAGNGREAIEYLEENPVDVIFTDINMPLADGIDVMKYASEHCPGTVKIVISGYGDFGYAQKAIRYGVKEYLLKPIVKKELETILKEISDSFNNNLLREQKSRLQDAVYTGKKEQQGERVQMAYFCAGPFVKEGLEESVEECDFWKGTDVEREVCSLLPESTHVYSFEKYQANERIVLLVAKKKIDMYDFSVRFISMMKERGIIVTAACCPEMIEMSGIPDMSRRLRKRIRKNILFCKESVSEEPASAETDGKAAGIHTKSGSIKSKKEDAALKEAEALLRSRTLRQEECTQVLRELLGGFLHAAGTGEEDAAELDETVMNLILYSGDAEQLIANLRQMLNDKNLRKKEDTTEDIMRRMEAYIREHMTEPVTASVLAAEFGLVAPYLSKLFKEYSGYTPAQYIQKIRLERAKKLLESEGDILAKDVAEMVGYPNPLYFSKVFKKNVGVYPSEYRKNRQKETGRRKEDEI